MKQADARHPAVVVIGGGPAGAAVAIACGELGHDVELLERDRFPRSKVCGCCLADRGVEALRRFGLHDLVGEGIPLHSVGVGCQGRHVELPFHGSVVISRETLDTALVEHAVGRGTRLRTRVRAHVDHTGVVHATDLETGETFERKPKVIVVADGLEGRALDEHPDFTWRVSNHSRFGAGLSIDPGMSAEEAPPPGRLTMLAGRGGYLGLVRLPDGRLDLAAAIDREVARGEGGPAGIAARLLEDDGRPRLADMVSKERWRGTPRLTRSRRVASGNIACIGDAAGYVEPFTGEGMSWAIGGAHRLAQLVDRAIVDGRSLDAWRHLHRRATWWDRLRCRSIALAVRHPGTAHAMLRGAARLPILGSRLADTASGATSNHGGTLAIGGKG